MDELNIFESPLELKSVLDCARYAVVDRIVKLQALSEKYSDEWWEQVLQYNKMNEAADRFYEQMPVKDYDLERGISPRLDRVLFKRLRFGKDKEMLAAEKAFEDSIK